MSNREGQTGICRQFWRCRDLCSDRLWANCRSFLEGRASARPSRMRNAELSGTDGLTVCANVANSAVGWRMPSERIGELSFRLRERLFLYRRRHCLLRLAAFRRPAENIDALRAAVRAKNLVFCVTAGRTGTTYLQHLLALCPETTSLHEPEPSFVPVLRLAQHDASVARTFLLEYKLPFIAGAPTRNYVETGHLICKGFLEPLLALGIVPRIVFLRRAPRPIAASLLARRTVPGRTKLGLKYLLHPGDPRVVPLPGWLRMTDYQLCFWYALEIERRQRLYAAQLDALGATLVDVTADELHDGARFLDVAAALELLDDTVDRAVLLRHHAEISSVVHNANSGAPEAAIWDGEEDAVWRAVDHFDPTLRAAVQVRYDSLVEAPPAAAVSSR
jgi:hypothetical protein